MADDYKKLAQTHGLNYDSVINSGFTDDDIKWYNDRKEAEARANAQPRKLEQLVSPEPAKYVDKDAPDFIPGVLRGIDQTQAMGYGAGALVGKGLEALGMEDTGQAVKDWGMEGYRRNIDEAGENAKKYSFKDVYTGKAGFGGAIDYAQGTLGELVPSMAEAAIGAAIGAAAGSASAPGPGTIGGGVVGAFAGRTLLKKSIDQLTKKALKEGLEGITESQLRKQITKQALTKFGGKVGMGAAVMPMETGGMYAELLEEKGVDAPGTAMFFGALATSLEYAGGNSKLVGGFIDALGKGNKGVAKKTLTELLTNIPQEALQEGGQEAFGILNKVVNTDEEFFTAENIEQIVESMGAGAVGGGAGAMVSGGLNQQEAQTTLMDERFENIKALGEEKLPAALLALDQEVAQNTRILQNRETLEAMAAESGTEVDDLALYLSQQNKFNNDLKTKLQEDAQVDEQATDQAAPDAPRNVDEVIAAQRAKQTADQALINQQMQDLDLRIEQVRETFFQSTDPEEKALLNNQLLELVDEKKVLLGEAPRQATRTQQTPDTDKQAMYDELFGSVNVAPAMRSAQESAEVFAEQEPEITDPEGKPFQTAEELEAQMAEMPDAGDYQIVKTQDGFIGIKKILGEAPTVPFTDEQQVGEAGQVLQCQT